MATFMPCGSTIQMLETYEFHNTFNEGNYILISSRYAAFSSPDVLVTNALMSSSDRIGLNGFDDILEFWKVRSRAGVCTKTTSVAKRFYFTFSD